MGSARTGAWPAYVHLPSPCTHQASFLTLPMALPSLSLLSKSDCPPALLSPTALTPILVLGLVAVRPWTCYCLQYM